MIKVSVNEKAQKRIVSGHPWIFRSDIADKPPLQAGIVSVLDLQKKYLGKALFSPHSQISLRMLTRTPEEIDKSFWDQKLSSAWRLRESLQIPSNAYRVVYGEVDGIPSFILDRYAEAYSFQILSAGLETRREILLDLIREKFHPSLLVERNDVSVRNLEQLPLTRQILEGSGPAQVQVQEENLVFEVDLLEGQKTGAFLDQRDNRFFASVLAKGKNKILDVFSYQGWFACHMAQGALTVTCIDQSLAACQQIEKNAELNRLKNIQILNENAFDFLKEADQRKEKFQMINLDPPAFVKNRAQISQALKGYKEINLRALRLLDKEGILITSSCSHHLSLERFFEVIREAAQDAKRELQILKIGRQAPDHPALLNFQESEYLKCIFLRVL